MGLVYSSGKVCFGGGPDIFGDVERIGLKCRCCILELNAIAVWSCLRYVLLLSKSAIWM